MMRRRRAAKLEAALLETEHGFSGQVHLNSIGQIPVNGRATTLFSADSTTCRPRAD